MLRALLACALAGVTLFEVSQVMVAATNISAAAPFMAQEAAGAFTAEQAARGNRAYQARCARCHLENLLGNDMAPALVGSTFLAGWENKSARALYSRILSTMPSDDPGSVEPGEAIDIVAFVLQKNGVPSGATALDRDRAQQFIIRTPK